MKKQINEIYWIRAVACLSVVFIHTLTRTFGNFDLPVSTKEIMKIVQISLMFATPMFILIFEVILGNAYWNRLPDKFFRKRFLYLFLPYLSIPFLYGIYEVVTTSTTTNFVLNKTLTNIQYAYWHGYFILIILQFVLIHAFFVKFLKGIPAWIMLVITLIINARYLHTANFNFDLMPPIMHEWYSLVRVPFLGWIFYFTVAYYAGKYLIQIREKRKWGFPVAIVASGISLYYVLNNYNTGALTQISSVRFDILFYTVSLFFAFYYLFSYTKTVPKSVKFISKYSFPIYLLHYIGFDIITPFLSKMNMGLFIILLFGAGIFIPVAIAKVFNCFPFGKFIVGHLRSSPIKEKKEYRAA
ncbi:acyltransferase family protein [Sutcliffiella rhizosphaerae]|uniref:Poly-beta-1,6-N-acetyl-D-glucosamine export protein n=1 Tax=Sutcliffiella rhizosphaerae TaxID=2880967 RepID=A0ABM8YTC3_9BACI|nr:acyltransferase family protein [Sutcliffiella rhizosphaerae]CAG9623259.1 putative poly-beta-1,6-N-acetyl-D-glucosamine export protein [Sutcliffiella rhizosphaerae]